MKEKDMILYLVPNLEKYVPENYIFDYAFYINEKIRNWAHNNVLEDILYTYNEYSGFIGLIDWCYWNEKVYVEKKLSIDDIRLICSVAKILFDNPRESIEFYWCENRLFYIYREIPFEFSLKKEGKIRPYNDTNILREKIDEYVLKKYELLSSDSSKFNYLDIDTKFIYNFADTCEIKLNKIPDMLVCGFDNEQEKRNAFSLVKLFLKRKGYDTRFYIKDNEVYVWCEKRG